MDKEEGEMSDEGMIVDDVEDKVPISYGHNEDPCTVVFKAQKDGIVIEKLEKVDAAKLEERAKRFGLDISGRRLVSQAQIDELYTNSGIESGNERHFRFDGIHLNGIDGLTTKEIFEYLEDFKPIALEKVDDVSCNIVCQDHISAALALLVHSREIRNEELKTMLAKKSDHHWREGMPHPKKDLILMRFATNGDKKISKKKKDVKSDGYDQSMDPVSKNPWGDLCQSWGVYDHQEVFQRKLAKNDYEDDINETREFIPIKNKKLAMRLGKRRHQSEESEESNSDSEWKKKSKSLRMRMRADDEETKMKKLKPQESSADTELDAYAPLSIEVVNSHTSYAPRTSTKVSDKFKCNYKSNIDLKDSIQSRLGAKVVTVAEPISCDEFDRYSSDESDCNTRSQVKVVSGNIRQTNSIWSRLESNKNDGPKSDLRQMLSSKKTKSKEQHNIESYKSDDLRDRIRKQKKANLRIEINNK